MYFVISPTKDMKVESISVEKKIPIFIEKTKRLMNELKKLSVDEIMKTMHINEKIARLNVERYQNFAYDINGQAAIDTYHGLQFKQLCLDEYDQRQLCYMNEHIRILSGLYGVLKPFDSIYPYRLEMKYKPFNLYAFWKKDINDYFKDKIVINVASNEYGDLLEGINVYQVVFKVSINDRLIAQSTQVKMARGKFIDYVIKKQIQTIDEIKKFQIDGYAYSVEHSNEHLFMFIKEDQGVDTYGENNS